MRDISPYEVMWTLWYGMLSSIGYGVVSFVVLWGVGGKQEAQPFLFAYTSTFKTIVSLGLILGTALIIFRYQNMIMQVIEAAFTENELSGTNFFLRSGLLRTRDIRWSSRQYSL